MRPTTEEMVKTIRKFYIEMAFGEEFEAKLQQEVRDELDTYHIKNIGIDLEGYGPIKAGFVEAFFSDSMSIDAVRLVIALCVSTRSRIDEMVARHVMKEVAINAVAQSTPKGDA